MLKMTGIRLHPAVRILIGAIFVAIGLARHDAISMVMIGGVLVLWGVAAVLALAGGSDHDAHPDERRSR